MYENSAITNPVPGGRRPRRILITAQPGVGHLGPVAPLGRALAAAGHEVRVATAPSFAPIARALGLAPVAAGRDWLLAAEDAAFPKLAALRATAPEAIDDWAAREMFRGDLAERMVPDLLRLAAVWRPDLVVREPLEFGGRVAAEALGVPLVTAGALWFRDPAWEAAVGDRLEALRRRHNLAPDPGAAGTYGDLALPTMPPSWVAPEEPLPPRVRFVRPGPIHPAAAVPDDLAAWTAGRTGRPKALVSLGTVFNRPAEFAVVLEALAAEPVEALVTVGANLDPAQFGPLPDHLRLARYAPHEALLPHCNLFVTHGGFSSLMAAARAGVPVVVLPIGGDQPRNALRAERLGIGLAVGGAERTPEAIRRAIRAVALNAGFRARAAARLRAEIETLPGSDTAAEVLAGLCRAGV